MSKDYKGKGNKGRRPQKGTGKEKNFYQDKPTGDERSKIDYHYSTTNDYRWYCVNPQLLKDTCSMAYGYATGTRLRLGSETGSLVNSSMPGICAIKYVPTIGWADHENSPVNVCARAVQTFIRHANSGAKNYDSPDTILYLLSMDSAIAYLEWMKRLYGTLGISNAMNRYFPKALIAAQGASYDDLLEHIVDLRAYINLYATKLGALAIPANMPLMAKHQWMNRGFYMDSQSPKAQTYLFVPEGFHHFTHDVDGAGMLEFTALGDTDGVGASPIMTFDLIKEYGDFLLDPILYGLGEEDFNTISGDIMKAYSSIYKAEGIGEGYAVGPVYDETVLAQIQNCTMFGYSAADNYDFVQASDKSCLLSRPAHVMDGTQSKGPASMDRLITTNLLDPSPAFTMEATRLCNIPTVRYDAVTEAPIAYEFQSAGSEITTRAYIYYYSGSLDGKTMELKNSDEIRSYDEITFGAGATVMLGELQQVMAHIDKWSLLSNFGWHPTVNVLGVIVSEDGAQNDVKVYGKGFMGDINNYAIVTQNNLIAMAEVALLSEFDIQNFGQ